VLKLGLVAANAGDAAAAAAHLRRVIEIAPDSAEATQARTILAQLK
jgi:Flp pilus assembly protein TadD